jgi:SAM-dependent methyltransferase
MVDSPNQGDVWASGAAYEAYMGRWSRRLAKAFVIWLGIPAGTRWLDVGCGTGALSQAILEEALPQEVIGIDPSEGNLDYARQHINDDRARFELGEAQALPYATAEFGAVVSGLVLNFVPDPDAALSEMTRVTQPGDTVGAYVWDYAGEMQMLRYFWDAARAFDQTAADLDEGSRFPLCRPEPLRKLFWGLRDVSVAPLVIPTRFQSFDDYWTPFLGGQGPAPTYVASLGEDRRIAFRERIKAALPIAPDGSINLIARAWAVRGGVRATPLRRAVQEAMYLERSGSEDYLWPALVVGDHWFHVDIEDYGSIERGVYQILAAALRGLKLSNIPPGTSIRLCNRIIGSDELTARCPDVVFANLPVSQPPAGTYRALWTIPVVWPDDTDPQWGKLRRYLDTQSAEILSRVEEITGVAGAREVSEEIAYVKVELSLPDQLILDAEDFVGQLESRVLQDVDDRLLFVCHAREDSAFVEKLVEALDGRALHAWYDRREIIAGDSIVDRINQGLTNARYLLVVLSPRSVDKPWVKRELNAALMKQLSSAAVRVIPLLLEDCKIPPLLADIRYADFRTSFDQGLSELLPAVRAADR